MRRPTRSRTFRFPPEVDDAVRLAARAAGETLTDFVLLAALDRADEKWKSTRFDDEAHEPLIVAVTAARKALSTRHLTYGPPAPKETP